MNIRMNLEYSKFEKNCKYLISEIPRASRAVMEQAGKEIIDLSRSIVPIDTDTLRETAYYRVEGTSGRYDVTVGYADPEHDKMNPKTKRMASEYVVAVHEDLLAGHDHGVPLFLRNAVAFWAMKYPRIVKSVFQQLNII